MKTIYKVVSFVNGNKQTYETTDQLYIACDTMKKLTDAGQASDVNVVVTTENIDIKYIAAELSTPIKMKHPVNLKPFSMFEIRYDAVAIDIYNCISIHECGYSRFFFINGNLPSFLNLYEREILDIVNDKFSISKSGEVKRKPIIITITHQDITARNYKNNMED